MVNFGLIIGIAGGLLVVGLAIYLIAEAFEVFEIMKEEE